MSLLEKSSSIELSRRTQPFYAKRSTYNLGAQVQIEVDLQRELIDFENSRLVFDVNFTQNTDGWTINPFAASGFIKNLRVKTLAGQMIGHEIREYRAWCRMYKELTSNDENNASYDGCMEGAPIPAGTGESSNAATFQRQYAHKFMSHIFTIKEYYPAHFHQGLMIEFDLPAVASELVVNDDANVLANMPGITFDNCKYVADLVQLKPEMENDMVKMMEQQRLFADYTEVLTQENTLTAGASQTAFDVVGIDGRVKSIFQYQITDALRGTAGTPDVRLDHWAAYSLNGQSQYRFKLGANYLNYANIDFTTTNNAEQCMELLKALDYHHSSAHSKQAGRLVLSAAALSSTKVVLGVKVDKAQKYADTVISSMVDKDRNNIRVELSASTGASTSYTHVLLDKRIQILSGSIVRNVRS